MMRKDNHIRRLALVLAFVMAFSLVPVSVHAEGDPVEILASDWTYTGEGVVVSKFMLSKQNDTDDPQFTYDKDSKALILEGGTLIVSTTSQTTEKIIVSGDATLILDGVDIAASNGPAIKINPGVTANINTQNTNTIAGASNFAALEVGWENSNHFASLVLAGEGTLTAKGGSNSAGIGGSHTNKNSNNASICSYHGNITILNGTINATGATGIGTGDNNGFSEDGSDHHSNSYKMTVTKTDYNTLPKWGFIRIKGGSINVYNCGTGIGGGNHVDSGKIYIEGGYVNAKSGNGVGVGCGLGSHNAETKGPGYYCADVTISGGTVEAYASGDDNWGGAGIGGGGYSDAIVTITGGTVIAKGGNPGSGHNALHHGGAGIGGGYEGHGIVSISDNATVYASIGENSCAAAIGSGGAPNQNPARGNEIRNNSARQASVITINGGSVTADASMGRGGAGIGSGNGADNVVVNIYSGTVNAYGARSDENGMLGGAGIGSGLFASGLQIPGTTKTEGTKYHSLTNVSITITNGKVTAIGGWGAAGIGSGAKNKIANEITISGGDIQAYSDGTKFAIDTRVLNEDGTTTSYTAGRTITTPILQGTFVHEYAISGITQNPEGLNPIAITRDTDESVEKTLTLMPASYRSFAATVSAAGDYNVYTNAETIGAGGGRYFSETMKDQFNADEVQDLIKYTVTGNTLSDNFYLFPVKTVVVEKAIAADEGSGLTEYPGLTADFSFGLQAKSDGEYKGGGFKTISIVDGVPQGRAYFINVPDDLYDLWEMNGDEKMSVGDQFGDYEISKISAESTGGTNNNGRIDEDQWTDKITITNTFKRVIPKIDIEGEKTWADANNQDGKRPEKITVNLLADGETYKTQEITPDAEGNWTYKFEQVPEIKADGTKIVYTVNEEAVTGYETAVDGYNITNTHTPEKITVSGEKPWADAENQDGKRPESITVHLLAGGTEVAKKTVTAADEWKWSFEGLDKYAAGKEIAYTVTEDAVANYETVVDGYNITNTHSPEKITVSGAKTWNDAENQDGKRPESITVHLLANGTEVGKKTVTAADEWKWSFEGLDKYAAGKEIA